MLKIIYFCYQPNFCGSPIVFLVRLGHFGEGNRGCLVCLWVCVPLMCWRTTPRAISNTPILQIFHMIFYGVVCWFYWNYSVSQEKVPLNTLPVLSLVIASTSTDCNEGIVDLLFWTTFYSITCHSLVFAVIRILEYLLIK